MIGAPVYAWDEQLQRKVCIGTLAHDGRDGLLPDRPERRDSRLIEHAPGFGLPSQKEMGGSGAVKLPKGRCRECGAKCHDTRCRRCFRAAQTTRKILADANACRSCGTPIGRYAVKCASCAAVERADRVQAARRRQAREHAA